MQIGKLYIIPTPIGNLGDITLRALDTLKKVDLILAEDTRVTGILLKHFDISKPMQSMHKFNEHSKIDSIVNQILQGKDIGFCSDAGTPGISDPGFLITKACIDNNIEVLCLPGATAFVPALVLSGLATDRFCFEGFLPLKKGRQSKLNLLKNESRTIVIYESAMRIAKTLLQLAEIFGPERHASLSREISKKFEETKRGTLSDLASYFKNGTKGEIVLIIEGYKA